LMVDAKYSLPVHLHVDERHGEETKNHLFFDIAGQSQLD
jgi:hypothetical protein